MENSFDIIKKAFTFENSIVQKTIFYLLFLVFFALNFEYYYLSYFLFTIINIMVFGIAIGVFFVIKQRKKLISWNKINGIVIGLNDKKKHYGISSPIIQFNYNNKIYQFENEVYEKSFNQSYLINDNIEVLFDIKNPHDAIINSKFSIWSKPLSMLFIVIGTFAINLYLIIYSQ